MYRAAAGERGIDLPDPKAARDRLRHAVRGVEASIPEEASAEQKAAWRRATKH